MKRSSLFTPFLSDAVVYRSMTDIVKDAKNVGQNLEAKAETAKDHAEGKPSSETLNKAKIKADDAAKDLKRDL
jgi:hypothetical protein